MGTGAPIHAVRSSRVCGHDATPEWCSWLWGRCKLMATAGFVSSEYCQSKGLAWRSWKTEGDQVLWPHWLIWGALLGWLEWLFQGCSTKPSSESSLLCGRRGGHCWLCCAAGAGAPAAEESRWQGLCKPDPPEFSCLPLVDQVGHSHDNVKHTLLSSQRKQSDYLVQSVQWGKGRTQPNH